MSRFEFLVLEAFIGAMGLLFSLALYGRGF